MIDGLAARMLGRACPLPGAMTAARRFWGWDIAGWLAGTSKSLALAVLWLPLAALAVPASASGSTATLRPVAGSGGEATIFRYDAVPGEVNALEVSGSVDPSGGVTLTATDAGALISAGEGCTSSDAHTVRCQTIGTFPFVGLQVKVRLGDQDDDARLTFVPSINATFSPVAIGGGSGNDRLALPGGGDSVHFGDLSGGPGDDVLTGSDGNDNLDGGGGRDELHGGAGSNMLVDGDHDSSADADILDGGGNALLDYSSRTKPLRVDLADPAPDGAHGEGDLLTGIDHLVGGHGGDLLAGTEGDNGLNGGGGADRIYGRGGNDSLGLTGPGRAVGGTGDDDISPGAAAAAVCGPGSDTVVSLRTRRSRPGPWLSRSCERISVADASAYEAELFVRPGPLRASHGARLLFRVPCLTDRAPACPQRLSLSGPRPPFVVIASRRFEGSEAGRRIAIRIPTRLARRARRQPVRLRIRLDGVIARSDSFPHGVAVTWRFDLKLPLGRLGGRAYLMRG